MVRSGGLGPGNLPPPSAKVLVDRTPSLADKEAAQVQQQRLLDRVSRADAQRQAQQAGFHKYNKTGRRVFDKGDSSRSPIPLPDDDVDPDVWDQETLDGAQENLAMVGTQLEQVAGEAAEGGPSLAEGLASSSYLPTEQGVASLENLLEKPAPEPIAMDEVTNSIKGRFNLEIKDTVPMGKRLIATGLVVAGERSAVQPEGDDLNDGQLTKGVQKVTQEGNNAVHQARQRSSEANRNLSIERTRIHRR